MKYHIAAQSSEHVLTMHCDTVENDKINCGNIIILFMFFFRTEYGLYLNDWPQLNFDIKSEYLLKIHCYDDEHTASNTATVTIVKNSDPVFDNLDGKYYINLDCIKYHDCRGITYYCDKIPGHVFVEIYLIETHVEY